MMEIMSGRLSRLKYAVEGLKRSGLPLVGHDGYKYIACEKGDDIALYYFAPKLMAHFGLSDVAAVKLFLSLIVGVSFGLGLVGLFLLIKSWRAMIIAVFSYLTLLAMTIISWDVYVVSSSIVVGIIPIFIYIFKRWPNSNALVACGGFAGFLIALVDSVRIGSGDPVAIFISVLVFFNKKISGYTKKKFALFFLVGMIIPQSFLNKALIARDAFIKEQDPTYSVSTGRHPFWHSIFVGMSFLDNDHGAPRNDQGVIQKVRAVLPNETIFSEKYEAAAKSLVTDFALAHPYFVIRSIFAKIGVLVLYALVFGRMGLFLALKKKTEFTWPFVLAIAFSSLPGICVTPYHSYCLGFMALVTIFSIMGWVNQYKDHNDEAAILAFMEKLVYVLVGVVFLGICLFAFCLINGIESY